MRDITLLRDTLCRAIIRQRPSTSDFDLHPEITLPEGRKLRDAGVLVAIRQTDSGPVVVLTKRSSALKHHPGQIAFPGGKVDEGDGGVVGAALREAEEEIGLPSDAVDVLGTLPAHETVTGFLAVPVVALITRDITYRREAGEVEEVFEVPLDHLMAIGNYSVQARRWRGQRRAYFTVPWGPYYIWGATARMLRGLAERMADDAN